MGSPCASTKHGRLYYLAPYTNNWPEERVTKDKTIKENMSSTNEEIENKLGHPPAMKVGGVRIAQRRRSFDEKEEAPKPQPQNQKNGEEETTGEEKEDEQTEEKNVTKSNTKAGAIVSGVQGNPTKDFPTAAVKHTHDKPVPTHTPPHTSVKQTVIQQPRKQ